MTTHLNESELRLLPNDIKETFKQLDSYDEPCFVFLYSNADITTQESVLTSVLKDIIGGEFALQALQQNVTFTTLDCDHIDARTVAESTVNKLEEQQVSAKVSVFRHNALSSHAETFDWGVQQLLSLLEQPQTAFAVNDFTDRRNWPGIEQYRKPTDAPSNREPQSRSGLAEQERVNPVKRFFQRLFNRTTTIPEPLQQLHPFIVNLPRGEQFWHYVLSGEHQQELHQAEAFIDLDAVLVLAHAKQYAPDFYHHMLDICCYDTTPEQNEIHAILCCILEPLSEALLEPEITTAKQQACFLRVLDIFFCLFDQQAFEKDIYALLVTDEATQCLSEHEYKQRYTVVDTAAQETISVKTMQAITEILDSLDNYFHVDHDDFAAIERIFSTNRNTYDYQLWLDEDEETLCRLLAAVLLYLDSKNHINDHYTEALQQFVDEGIVADVLTEFKNESESLPDALENWLETGSGIEFSTLVEQLKNSLNINYGSNRQAAQPSFDLFCTVGSFRPILAMCYWRSRAAEHAVAQRVIQLAMALAPQATLSSLSRFYRDGIRGFSNEPLQQEFFESLKALGISEYDLIAFKIRLSANDDYLQLEKWLHRYIEQSEPERQQWNAAVNRLSACDRDDFYLSVYRFNPALNTPLCQLRKAVLNELMRVACHHIDDVTALSDVAEQFLNGEISFSSYQSLTRQKIDSSEFQPGNDLYSEFAPKILPQLLTEPNEEVQLRCIKLLGSDPKRGKLIQAELTEELFFDEQLKNQTLDFQSRCDISVDDLTPEWLTHWKNYQKQISAKLASL